MISVLRLPKQEATKVADIMLLYKLAMQIRSFLGSISTLMKGSGLEEYLQTAYKGVQNMLNGNCGSEILHGVFWFGSQNYN